MNFNLLCKKIGIHSDQSTAEQLKRLQQWFVEHISSDLYFSGTEQKQFEQIKRVSEYYLESILPLLSQELTKSNPVLDGENLISALASMGFDRVLLSLNTDKNNVNTKNAQGLFPLHLAAIEGHYQTVQTLLAAGAEIGVLNQQKQYPLFSALILPSIHTPHMRQNKIRIFNLLKNEGFQFINHQDVHGNTVLHQMALHGFDTLIQDILLTNPDLCYLKNNHSHYPIHTAILNNRIQSVIPLLHFKDVAMLTDSKGWTAMHYAALYAHNAIMEECSKLAPNINVLDKMGRTPLMLAAESGRIEAMQILLHHHADFTLTDSLGYSVLHHSVKARQLDTVRWLIENINIDINAKDNKGYTPLKICEMIPNLEIKNEISALLVNHGAHATI
ncbi:Ankyrin repeat protein [Legionella wadsworthii]|uniref:Ankyrin repeat protein n=1 Tax=Legionella wadsworthii TaxID=28088 RepID=A0A378LVT0_9GAMM|nr:ankyrin repeat domain-containing protein [Legionella wadsworthii]STY29992.1 Ankyrin repeat protein [Legionella wadsworthii]